MTHGHNPTLNASMDASPATRVTVYVLAGALIVVLLLGAFAAGAVHATDARFQAIESAVESDRGVSQGRHDRDEWTRRDVFEQLAEIKAEQQAAGRLLLELRDDVKAIRDAVAPLPRSKGGE